MTLIIAVLHAFRTNTVFNPESLYFGALLFDMTVLWMIARSLGLT